MLESSNVFCMRFLLRHLKKEFASFRCTENINKIFIKKKTYPAGQNKTNFIETMVNIFWLSLTFQNNKNMSWLVL